MKKIVRRRRRNKNAAVYITPRDVEIVAASINMLLFPLLYRQTGRIDKPVPVGAQPAK